MHNRVLPPNDDSEIKDVDGNEFGWSVDESPQRLILASTDIGRLFAWQMFDRSIGLMVDDPRIREEEVYYYHSDHLGGANWVTDAEGNPVQYLQYLPFGEPLVNHRISNYNERFTFTGKERDAETGYGYFGARYMDHELMTMWLSVDPMADKYPSINPYAYCAWNPVKLVDPDGEDIWKVNDSGELIWQKSSATDKIIANDGSSVDVAEGVLIRGVDGHRGQDYKMENHHYGLSFGDNEDNAYEVFEFLADHSNVEYSLIETNFSGGRHFSVTTSFEKDGDSWGCQMSNRANINGTLKSHTHSHPNGSLAQSFEKDVFSFIGNTEVDAYVYCPKGRNTAPQYRNGGYHRYHSSQRKDNTDKFSQSKMTINGKEKTYKRSH